jgi:hypothetical protein
MDPTVATRRRFLPVLAIGLVAASACAAASAATATAPAPAIVLLAMPASPESTLALAKFALGEVDGTLQAIQWRPNSAVLSTRFTRNHRGVGMSEIAIIAAVGRQVADSTDLASVELVLVALEKRGARRLP